MTRKIESVAQKYNLETRIGQEIDDELVDRWKGDGRVEMGYRRVADWLNMEIIRSAYEDAGLTLIDNRIEADYEVLEGDDEVEKRSLVDELEKQGVDVNDIMNDFVGDTTVYHYLTKYLGAEKEKVPEDPREWSPATVDNRLEKTENKYTIALNSLDVRSQLDLEGDVDVDIVVSDENGTAPISRVLEKGYVPPQEEESTGIQLSERANNIIPDLNPLS